MHVDSAAFEYLPRSTSDSNNVARNHIVFILVAHTQQPLQKVAMSDPTSLESLRAERRHHWNALDTDPNPHQYNAFAFLAWAKLTLILQRVAMTGRRRLAPARTFCASARRETYSLPDVSLSSKAKLSVLSLRHGRQTAFSSPFCFFHSYSFGNALLLPCIFSPTAVLSVLSLLSWELTMASSLLILTTLSLVSLASSRPSVYFPFNSQLPPVARTAKVFSYTLSPQTFFSESNITYSLNDGPRWLSIDEQTGHLYGTPEEEDVPDGEVVGIPVDIIATDDSGSETMTATFVVSRNRAPEVAIPLSEQIRDFGDRAAPDALVSYPSSPFSFTFAEDTFSPPGPLNYYATSADSSPLPSWILFDAGNLTFSGQTPPFENLIQPPQTFSFHLVASDVEGFSAAYVLFSLVVGSRKLTMADPVVRLNATRGASISHRGLRDEIELDGEAVNPAELTVLTENMPEWLSVDESTLEIRGRPPTDARSSNSTIILQNSLSDTLSIQMVVTIATDIFRRTVSDLEATATEDFSLDLEPYLWRPEDVFLEIETDPSQDWIELDGLVISGTPPVPSSQGDTIQLTLRATERSSGESETEVVRLGVLSPADLSSTTSTSTPTIAPTASETPTESESSDSEPGLTLGPGLSAEQIMLAVLVPIIVIASLVLLLLCLRRRRERKFRKIQGQDISRPVPGSFVENGSLYDDARSAKAHGAIPPPEAANRPGQMGYWRAALRRFRSTRSVASSLDGGSQPSITQEPPTLPKLPSVGYYTLPGAQNSWLTGEDIAGEPSRNRLSQRRSRYSVLSLYDSMRDIASNPPFSRNQTESSFRGKLDVTIPSADDLSMSFQPMGGTAQAVDKSKQPEGSSQANEVDIPALSAAASSDALSCIPERSSPLGSHPTYARKLPLGSRPRGFRVYSDSDAISQPSFETLSGYSEWRGDPKSLQRHESQSRWSDMSRTRPVSRRSDASPWFGGRSVAPPRHPRRYQFSADTSSSLLSGSVRSVSAGSGPRGDENENWQTIPPKAVVRRTVNWQTIPSESLGLRYQERELVHESPFYPSRSSRVSRPARSRRRPSTAVGGHGENKRYSTWMGKGVSLRERRDGSEGREGSQDSDSSVTLMSPSKWETARNREPLAERPVSSIRQVQPSGMWMKDGGLPGGSRGGEGENRGTYESSPKHSHASKGESDVSDWVTEVWSSLDREDSGVLGKRRCRSLSRKGNSQNEGLSALGRENNETSDSCFVYRPMYNRRTEIAIHPAFCDGNTWVLSWCLWAVGCGLRAAGDDELGPYGGMRNFESAEARSQDRDQSLLEFGWSWLVHPVLTPSFSLESLMN
ncbi:hypothetical protein SODALDRAFT_357832 [Sodiomyces alkalinus F11]|uniref:Dystroglycan-type cadherin-like domain-containing protein n=1 Tax=Sodiomyces alkalinus (strain CBS 110278 / VKM F-3762 / F11) TaxID=1314773 RepID=A0A3N2Q4Q5_SODAK|nr:hypothetical protein SODALDRAFT_357832 [Sodiomyces alkalinus F11]ROT41749.1 hypothetical protein SODALDRAFT_357832 [Sodiomyces alkalinus F11]